MAKQSVIVLELRTVKLEENRLKAHYIVTSTSHVCKGGFLQNFSSEFLLLSLESNFRSLGLFPILTFTTDLYIPFLNPFSIMVRIFSYFFSPPPLILLSE
jgi:hypothetical protein